MKQKLLVSLALLASQALFAQLPQKELDEADFLLYDEAFAEALTRYNEFAEKYPNDHSYRYHQLVAYHMTEGRGTDISELLAFEEEKGAKDEFYNYWLGRIHLLRYEFPVARKHFEAFLKLRAYKSSQIVDETRYLLEWNNIAEKFYANIDEYELFQLDDQINTKRSEVAPVFFKGHDELIFFRETATDPFLYEARHSVKQKDLWSHPETIKMLGTFGRFETRAEILAGDNHLLFYKDINGGDIYSSEFASGHWTMPVAYDPELKASISSDFFISADESKVLFSSIKGSKQLDIYEINRMPNGKWTKPIALSINSENYDEDFPFLSDDGKTLYFSSNRPESIGGFDVFKSNLNANGSWSIPENLGFPINTMDDEIHFQMNHGSSTGFFSSNRLHSQGGYDIYYFFKVEKRVVKGFVYDDQYILPVENLVVRFHPKKYTDESINTFTNPDGSYLLELIENETFEVEFLLEDQIIHTETVRVEKDQEELNFRIPMPAELVTQTDFSTLYDGEEQYVVPLEMLGNKFRRGNKAVIQNIYFDFESHSFNTKSTEILERLRQTLVKYPDIKIEIAGHTDNVGKKAYNQHLSQQRADAVKRYLIRKGIRSERLVAIGYGETQPLASNDDEQEGRELNRRIEVLLSE